MQLRQAKLKDIKELKRICIDSYAFNFHHHWNAGGLEWYLDNEFSTERLTTDLADKTTSYYFIEKEEKPVGFIKIRNHSVTNSSRQNSVELEKIYVLPTLKGMGIGQLALREIIKKAQIQHKKILFLYVIDTNISAITFYEKLGFKFHSKTILTLQYFKEELKGMHKMVLKFKV